MIDKTALNQFRSHMVKAAAEAGVKLEIGTITYHNDYFTFSSKAFLGDAGEQELFTKVANKRGFPANWYNMKFRAADGDHYRITGAKPRGRKNFLAIVRLRDQKGFVAPPGFVRNGTFINDRGEDITPATAQITDMR